MPSIASNAYQILRSEISAEVIRYYDLEQKVTPDYVNLNSVTVFLPAPDEHCTLTVKANEGFLYSDDDAVSDALELLQDILVFYVVSVLSSKNDDGVITIKFRIDPIEDERAMRLAVEKWIGQQPGFNKYSTELPFWEFGGNNLLVSDRLGNFIYTSTEILDDRSRFSARKEIDGLFNKLDVELHELYRDVRWGVRFIILADRWTTFKKFEATLTHRPAIV